MKRRASDDGEDTVVPDNMTTAGSAVTVDLDAAETVRPDPETMTMIMGPMDEAEETIEVRIEETMETPRVTGLKRS